MTFPCPFYVRLPYKSLIDTGTVSSSLISDGRYTDIEIYTCTENLTDVFWSDVLYGLSGPGDKTSKFLQG